MSTDPDTVADAELDWRRHEPVFTLAPMDPADPDVLLRDWQVTGCVEAGCRWRSTMASFTSTGFAEHLAWLGAPEYIVGYWLHWADRVEVPFGQLDREAVAQELAEYEILRDTVAAVYSRLAESLPVRATARLAVARITARVTERVAYQLCEAAHQHLLSDQDLQAATLITQATLLSPGIWEDFLADRDLVDTQERPNNVTFSRPCARMSEHVGPDMTGATTTPVEGEITPHGNT